MDVLFELSGDPDKLDNIGVRKVVHDVELLYFVKTGCQLACTTTVLKILNHVDT